MITGVEQVTKIRRMSFLRTLFLLVWGVALCGGCAFDYAAPEQYASKDNEWNTSMFSVMPSQYSGHP
jgi:hypothetical protein